MSFLVHLSKWWVWLDHTLLFVIGENFVNYALLCRRIFTVELFKGILNCSRLRFSRSNVHKKAFIYSCLRSRVQCIEAPRHAARLIRPFVNLALRVWTFSITSSFGELSWWGYAWAIDLLHIYGLSVEHGLLCCVWRPHCQSSSCCGLRVRCHNTVSRNGLFVGRCIQTVRLIGDCHTGHARFSMSWHNPAGIINSAINVLTRIHLQKRKIRRSLIR